MRVYSAPVLANVMLMKQILERAGIPCHIIGEFRGGAAGEIPPIEAWPELWVVDELHAGEAKRIVETTMQQTVEEGESWICPHCQEEIESQFDICWNCETDRPGLDTTDGPEESV